MKIAIIGYGRMGHEVEKAAVARGHEIVCRIDKDNRGEFDSEAFASADAAIEFTIPTQAFDNVDECLRRGIPVVSGTTGWSARFAETDARVAECKVPMVWASNFSIGVNLFMHINRELARLAAGFPQYSASMEEIHHIHKLDHPSGTAITLAEGIIAESRYTGWQETDGATPDADPALLPVSHRREGECPAHTSYAGTARRHHHPGAPRQKPQRLRHGRRICRRMARRRPRSAATLLHDRRP